MFRALSEDGLLDGTRGVFRFRSMALPDTFIDHDKYETMLAKAQLDAPSIVGKVLETLGAAQNAERVQIA